MKKHPHQFLHDILQESRDKKILEIKNAQLEEEVIKLRKALKQATGYIMTSKPSSHYAHRDAMFQRQEFSL